jgi:hypothetical protein
MPNPLSINMHAGFSCSKRHRQPRRVLRRLSKCSLLILWPETTRSSNLLRKYNRGQEFGTSTTAPVNGSERQNTTGPNQEWSLLRSRSTRDRNVASFTSCSSIRSLVLRFSCSKSSDYSLFRPKSSFFMIATSNQLAGQAEICTTFQAIPRNLDLRHSVLGMILPCHWRRQLRDSPNLMHHVLGKYECSCQLSQRW